MYRLILQVLVIGITVYLGYTNRYRLLNTVLSNGMLRKFLVILSLNFPGVRNRMMQGMFNQS